MKEEKIGTIYQLEILEKSDDSIVLYARKIGDKIYGVIPKQSYWGKAKITETETSFILDFIRED